MLKSKYSIMYKKGSRRMKKLYKTLSAAAVLVSMSVTAFAAPNFSDINTSNYAWAKPSIISMAEMGYISGYEDGTFRPDNDVTRLEALSLFARAMGSNDEVNKEILEIAHDKYDSVIDAYDLDWGQDEIAFLMYKGALKKTDLDTYLKDKEKDSPMKRYEAAIIITKAMNGEDEALSELGVVLDYSDAREVPSNAIQYVAYATEAGIMEGMEDGLFSPNTPVKRSQMAVMLERTVKETNYTFAELKITNVDTENSEITFTTDGGKEEKYVYTDSTSMKNFGDEVQPENLDTNISAIVTLSGNEIVSIDTLASEPDQTVRGKYVSFSTTAGVTTVRITPDDSDETVGYECSENLSVTYDGSPATVRSFTKGDVITLELSGGKIVNIIGETKTSTITGAIVEEVIVGDDIAITISHGDDEYDGKTYTVSSDVTVKKNDITSSLDSIYKGDKVSLTLEYGVITKITATSSKKTVEGTIKALTIASPQSSMTVSVNGTETTYEIPKDVQITINGETGSLYDFRVGDQVKITIESDAITRIVATTTQESSGVISGVVTGVNTSYGVISILPEGSTTGESKQVYCKDDITTFVDVNGASKKMKDVKEGQTVDVRGTVSNGAFIGKLVVIVTE